MRQQKRPLEKNVTKRYNKMRSVAQRRMSRNVNTVITSVTLQEDSEQLTATDALKLRWDAAVDCLFVC